MKFFSVRDINQATFKAAYGQLNGEHVYVVGRDGGKQRIQRAKTVKGDLYVRLNLTIPKGLTAEEKELYEKLRTLRP